MANGDTPQVPRKVKVLNREASKMKAIWDREQQRRKEGKPPRRVMEPFEDWFNMYNLNPVEQRYGANKDDFPYDESKFRYLTQDQWNSEDRAKRKKYETMYKEQGIKKTYESVKSDWLMDHPGEIFQASNFQSAIRGSVSPTDMSGQIMEWLKGM
tara:strand:- start:644 stop:1108 length:465 start_codon:yes stop_codon:yes gene_type:complete